MGIIASQKHLSINAGIIGRHMCNHHVTANKLGIVFCHYSNVCTIIAVWKFLLSSINTIG